MNIHKLRSSNMVSRYHTEVLVKEETVGHHCANVATTLIYMYYETYGVMPSSQLLTHAILHDVDEIATGDIPGPTKWANEALAFCASEVGAKYLAAQGIPPTISEVDTVGYRVFKFADTFDVVLKGLDELWLGNKTVVSMILRALGKTDMYAEEIHDSKLRDLAQQMSDDARRMLNDLT